MRASVEAGRPRSASVVSIRLADQAHTCSAAQGRLAVDGIVECGVLHRVLQPGLSGTIGTCPTPASLSSRGPPRTESPRPAGQEGRVRPLNTDEDRELACRLRRQKPEASPRRIARLGWDLAGRRRVGQASSPQWPLPGLVLRTPPAGVRVGAAAAGGNNRVRPCATSGWRYRHTSTAEGRFRLRCFCPWRPHTGQDWR